MTEAERQARNYAEVRARLFGKSAAVNRWAEMAQVKHERRKLLQRSRFAEVKNETRIRRTCLAGIRVEAFRTFGAASFNYDQALSASVEVNISQRLLDPELIAASVLVEYPGISLRDLRGSRGCQHLVMVRNRVIGEIHRLRPDISFVALGKFMNRDHTSIMHSLGRKKRAVKKPKAKSKPRQS